MLQKNSYIYEEYIFSSHQHTLKGDTYLGGWVGGGGEITLLQIWLMIERVGRG